MANAPEKRILTRQEAQEAAVTSLPEQEAKPTTGGERLEPSLEQSAAVPGVEEVRAGLEATVALPDSGGSIATPHEEMVAAVFPDVKDQQAYLSASPEDRVLQLMVHGKLEPYALVGLLAEQGRS